MYELRTDADIEKEYASEVIKLASVFPVKSRRVSRAFALLRYELVLVALFLVFLIALSQQ